jgi:hypothetical protein
VIRADSRRMKVCASGRRLRTLDGGNENLGHSVAPRALDRRRSRLETDLAPAVFGCKRVSPHTDLVAGEESDRQRSTIRPTRHFGSLGATLLDRTLDKILQPGLAAATISATDPTSTNPPCTWGAI